MSILYVINTEEVSDLEQLEAKYIAYSSLEANRDVMYYIRDLKLARWEYANLIHKYGHYKLSEDEIKQYKDYLERLEQEDVETGR